MSLLSDHELFSKYFGSYLENFREALLEALIGKSSDNDEAASDAYQINDNVVDNNAAILLTDNAESTVNFLYVNPIEFFNNGRASDIYLDIDLSDTSQDAAGSDDKNFEFLDEFNFMDSDTDEDTGSASGNSSGNEINGNVIGNNAAILLTDDAQSTVNFLYINPIEFFNNGRASDIYINISPASDTTTTSDDLVSALADTGTSEDAGSPTDQVQDNFFEEIAASESGDDDFGFLDGLGLQDGSDFLNSLNFLDDFGFMDGSDFLDGFDLLDGISFLDALSFLDEFSFPDPSSILDDFGFGGNDTSDDIGNSIGGSSGGGQFNDNVIGNNAAILMTDDAQSTVNFLYINPIQFFNDGRAGDIHLNITLEPGDEFHIL